MKMRYVIDLWLAGCTGQTLFFSREKYPSSSFCTQLCFGRNFSKKENGSSDREWLQLFSIISYPVDVDSQVSSFTSSYLSLFGRMHGLAVTYLPGQAAAAAAAAASLAG